SFASYQSTPAREPIRGVAALPALTSSYLDRLHRLLLRMDADWMTMSSDVSRVGQAGDPHQILLDVVGLHSVAVEYHQGYAESFDQLYNKLVLDLGNFLAGFSPAGYGSAAKSSWPASAQTRRPSLPSSKNSFTAKALSSAGPSSMILRYLNRKQFALTRRTKRTISSGSPQPLSISFAPRILVETRNPPPCST